ncbi:hypothetical protein ACFVKB_08075 [Rhodococcus sp. NPDC127530]
MTTPEHPLRGRTEHHPGAAPEDGAPAHRARRGNTMFPGEELA